MLVNKYLMINDKKYMNKEAGLFLLLQIGQ